MQSAFKKLMEDGQGTVTGGEEYLPSVHASKKKINPFKEDKYSGYEELKDFRPGHTPDEGGFQYKDLWGLNEIEREQKVKIVSGYYVGKTAVVHDFDSEKDNASGDDWVDVVLDTPKKPMVTLKASELKPLEENYARFKNETKTRTKPEQFHQAVKSVRKKVNEIAKLQTYLEMMKKELSEDKGLKYKKYTEAAIEKIKSEIKELYHKVKKFK